MPVITQLMKDQVSRSVSAFRWPGSKVSSSMRGCPVMGLTDFRRSLHLRLSLPSSLSHHMQYSHENPSLIGYKNLTEGKTTLLFNLSINYSLTKLP